MFLRETGSIRGRTAIEDGFGTVLTYGDLENLSQKYLEIVETRNLVFILCDYSIETVAFYYCMMNNHVVPLLLDNSLDTELLQNLIQLYQPQYIWCLKENVGQFESGICIKEMGGHAVIQTGYYAYQMAEELALLLTTSGSTGSPKMVRLSYGNIRSEAMGSALALDLQSDDKMITTLPMNYCYGLCVLHIHWMRGASVCVTNFSLLHSGFWELLERRKVTNFVGVPFSYEILYKTHFLEKEYPLLRFIIEGGGKLPEDKQEIFGRILRKKGMRLYIAYGQTEGLGILSAIPADMTCDKLGSIGVPIPGMRAYTENVGVGELIFRGSCVCLGYTFNKEGLIDGDSNKGILHTGDLACIDEEGFIFLRGRLKRFIKMLGIRINLDKVEELLRDAFQECDFACVGEDDNMRIYYTGNVDSAEICQFCNKKMSLQSRMLSCVHNKELPRNSSGKLMYTELE